MASLAFPQSVRLRERFQFRELNKHGARISSADLLVRYRMNGLQFARFGITVSRRVGNAVVRNRVKRQLREAIRHHRHGLTGIDIVVIAKPSTTRLKHEGFQQQIAIFCRQLLERKE